MTLFVASGSWFKMGLKFPTYSTSSTSDEQEDVGAAVVNSYQPLEWNEYSLTDATRKKLVAQEVAKSSP